MNICFKNARILTMKPGEEIFTGSLYTEGDRIVYAGPESDDTSVNKFLPEGYKADRTIDCGGNLLMPGFKKWFYDKISTYYNNNKNS